MELYALGQMVWLAVIVVVLFLIVAPVLIWHQTSKASRLLADLLDEQEHTNELLRALLKKRAAPTEEPDFLLSPRPSATEPVEPGSATILLAAKSESEDEPDADANDEEISNA